MGNDGGQKVQTTADDVLQDCKQHSGHRLGLVPYTSH